MNEERQYSDIEVLTDAIQTLGSLNIPVSQLEVLGSPIFRVRNNLIALLEALQQNASAAVPELEAEPECEVEEVGKQDE